MAQYSLIAYLTVQKREIVEHKDYLSEKAHRDVGMPETIRSWMEDGLAARFQANYYKHLEQILKTCESICGDTKRCRGSGECKLSMKTIHEILDDN